MNHITIIAGFLILFFAGGLKIILASSHLKKQVDQYQEFNLSTVQIIEKYGYPAETHTTETEDGYILTLHRIPHGKTPGISGIPVLLQHGLLADSAEFVLFGPNSTAFLLSDAGYDIWILNNRGNRYARKHRILSTEDIKFWDFSWHENGIYDLPAQIDYVCSYSQFDKILFVGYSMGTTQYFVMASERPEYQKKIRSAFMLAPIAYLKHTKSLMRLFSPGSNTLQAISEGLKHGEFSEQSPAYQHMVQKLCTSSSAQLHICRNIIFSISGYDREEFNELGLQNLISHIPSSTSTKTLAHYGQLMKSGGFHKYDYGSAENMVKYNQSTPPEYNLEIIKTPMAMFTAQNDYFVQPKDLVSLLRRLSCVRTIDVVPHYRFTHLDFIAAKHAKDLLYDKVLERINNFLVEDHVSNK